MHIVGTINRGRTEAGTDSSTIGLAAGISVGIVVFLGFVVFFTVWRRKTNNYKYNEDLESAEMRNLVPISKNKTLMTFKQPIEKHKKVQHLETYVVPDEKLRCAEYCFNIPLNVSIPPKNDPSVTHLQQILTALLNTSGGIIELENEGNSTGYWTTLDEYILDIESVLFEMIPESIYHYCVKFSDIHFPLQMLIKKSGRLITMNSHMYIRQSGRNKLLNDIGFMQRVMSQASEASTQLLAGVDSVEYGNSIDFPECVEYAHVSPDKFQNTRIPADIAETLTALSNMPSGGYCIIGIEINKSTGANTVLGVPVEKDVYSNLFGEFIHNDHNDNPCIWREEARVPQQGNDWTIKFIPVTGGPTDERRQLVVIYMNHCQGGVWTKCPESMMISEDGCVYEMTFDSWKRTISRTHAVATMPTNQAETERGEQYSDQHIANETPTNIFISEASHFSERDKSNTDRAKSLVGQRERKSHDISVDDILKNKGYISFAEHSSFHGKDNLKGATTDLLLNAHQFAIESHVFTPDQPMTVTPAKSIIISRHAGKEKEITAAIERIEAAEGSDTRSFCLITSNWTRDARSQREVERPPGHMFDVIVVDENGHFKLWAIVEKKVKGYKYNQTLIYTLVSGRKTKRSLLLNQPYFVSSASKYIPSVWIECHVFEIKNNKEFTGTQNIVLPRYFNTTKDNLEGIKLSLSMLMLNTVTTIKSIYGNELSYTLTSEQLNIIRHIGMCKVTFVEGPPGSGKTLLALYTCNHYSNCGYICTTETFKKYLIYQGLPEQSIFYTDSEEGIMRHIKNGDFANFEYLIYDDAHNSPFSERVWRKMCKSVSRSDKTNLVVFGDTRYQNFMETDERKTVSYYIDKFCQRSKNTTLLELSLSEVHRNTKTVTSFVASNFEQNADIACSSKEEGEVVVKCLSNIWSTKAANGLVSYVKDLVDHGELEKNEPRDIGIIVDIVEEKERITKNSGSLTRSFKDYFGDSMDVHDAGTFPVTGLTIDTLNNFMGFDREVCILVSDEQIQTTNQLTGHSFENPKYKAFVASRGTSKVVFVVDKELNSTLASKFHCDNITVPEPRRLWSKTMRAIDVCWLRMDQTAALLYTSDSGVSLVSLEGDNLDLTIDTSDIKGLRFVACSTSGQTIIMTDSDTPHSWTVYHRQDSGRYDRKATYAIDGRPVSVKLTSDGDVLMLVANVFDRYLRRYRAADGRLVWETSNVDMSRYPGALTVDSADGAYVCTQRTVVVYNPGGELIRTIPAPADLSDITAVCADSSGRWLVTGHRDGSVSLFRDGKLVRRQLIETGGNFIWNLCLYEDTYLGINTFGTLLLFNVKDAI